MGVPQLCRVLLVLVTSAALIGGCVEDDEPRPVQRRRITIPDLTGLSRTYAIQLVDNLDLEIRVEHVDPENVEDATAGWGDVPTGRFAGDTVLRQRPAAGTKVIPGAALTLLVPEERELRPDEEKYRLITHCGLSFPLEYDHRFWLPVDRKLRRSVSPPDGFSSEGFADDGTVMPIDDDTLIYTSSTGIEVEYQPTRRRPPGCE